MTDRPIIFSSAMIKALLAGRKTQTRRILKPQPARPEWLAGTWVDAEREKFAGAMDGERSIVRFDVRDRLWVRENYRVDAKLDDHKPRDIEPDWPVAYEAGVWSELRRAVVPDRQEGMGKLRPGMFMPRCFSRITLDVMGVRVQRLQDISDEDAIAEGVQFLPDGTPEIGSPYAVDLCPGWAGGDTARDAFKMLWGIINGATAWDANPWVVAVSFERTAPEARVPVEERR